MANDLCHLMISRSSYCFQHAFRWTVQIVSGCLSWLITSHASDFEGPRHQRSARDWNHPPGYQGGKHPYRRSRKRADRGLWFELYGCRREALESTGNVFDKCGRNAILHGAGDCLQHIQTRFYDLRTTRRLVGIRLYYLPAYVAQT